jgi:hypothetical protein
MEHRFATHRCSTFDVRTQNSHHRSCSFRSDLAWTDWHFRQISCASGKIGIYIGLHFADLELIPKFLDLSFLLFVYYLQSFVLFL